ncbi:MAG: FtsK/SpoIIIE domain-containing protein, partial [Micromonosporaceae bacterium]
DSGVVRFNRPPRILPPTTRPEVEVPAEPEKPRGFRFPMATVLLPLLLAGLLYAFMPNSWYFLIFLAFSPVMAIAHLISERRSGRKDYKEKLKAYQTEMAAVRITLKQLAIDEERNASRLAPDPATVVSIATGGSGRLFERRPSNRDFLRLRVGVANRPAQVRLTGQGAREDLLPTAYGAPVCVDLAEAGVLGVAGPRRHALAIARALLAQAGALHAPHDLGVMVLTGHDGAADWEWASWLPHTLPHRADIACRRMVASDRGQAEARISELRRLMDERRAERQAGLRHSLPGGRRVLLVLDGARRLRDLPGLADVLADGPTLGVYAVCLDTSEASLPDECRATVVVSSPSGSRVKVNRPEKLPQDEVLADGMPRRLASRLARALAPIRVLGARFGDDGDLPDSVRFLELAGLGADPAPSDVAAAWAAAPGGRDTRLLLGVGHDGPVTVDLRRDGPHALIAGTSGAGKSELLQTLVASLALHNAPDALNLVLVDYKGGSAFGPCRDLPHCVGMVTDLDGHLANRALASLSAELRRREAILAEADAKNLEDYWAITGGRLPRLVIVIDEFATLVEEVPDFVAGVVGIGMRGRSLGVHVVLATQRPGGVVNAEIRANVNLRVCLRVTSVDESSDVVSAPDAARISRLHPGRAYLRTGHSDLSVLQCARVGWPRVAAADDSAAAEVTVSRRRFADLGRPRLGGGSGGVDDGHDGDTDLTALVGAIHDAATQAGLSAPSRPWLPPLPEIVPASQLDTGGAESPVAAVVGLADLPASQSQAPYRLDLERTGPVVIAGMARTGRSTALRGLATALASDASPADVHLYALDYGNRALAPLAALPHCGACVDGDEPDRVERLLALLTADVARRGRVLSAGGHASLREQRAAAGPEQRLPYLVLLVDRYETFLTQHQDVDGGRLVDTLDGLLRRGPAVGIIPVIATDRTGFNHRLSSAIATRLVLRQATSEDVAHFGLNPRETPRAMPPGRALATPDGAELQFSLLSPDPDGAAQARATQRLAEELARRWDGVQDSLRPHRVDPLPTSISEIELDSLRAEPPSAAPGCCTVGAGRDHLGPVDVDLTEAGAAFLIAGPQRSGRSTALAAVVSSLAGRVTGEFSVIVCCPRPSPLTALAALPGVQVLRSADPTLELEQALAVADRPVALAVDDAELLVEGPAADLLEGFTRTARDSGNLVIAAGGTEDLMLQRYRGWLAMMRRVRCGLLLNPSSYVDGEVFDLKLPRSTHGGWPPGRALLAERGGAIAIQVAVPGVLSGRIRDQR